MILRDSLIQSKKNPDFKLKTSKIVAAVGAAPAVKLLHRPLSMAGKLCYYGILPYYYGILPYYYEI